jgi:hypothetical protein
MAEAVSQTMTHHTVTSVPFYENMWFQECLTCPCSKKQGPMSVAFQWVALITAHCAVYNCDHSSLMERDP